MLVLIDVWQSAPFVFLLLYAALQSVPQGQYEAARIDGANSLKILFYVTIPNIKNKPCALRSAAHHRQLPSVRQGKPADRRRPRQQHLHHHAVPLQLRHQIARLRLRQRRRHRHDHTGPHPFQRLHQTRDLLTAYETGYYRITAHLHQRGLRGKRYSSTPRDAARPDGRFYALIDGGSAADSEFADRTSGRIRAEEYLAPLPRLDLAVSTHIHEDHLCGLLRVCRDHPPAVLRQTLPPGFYRSLHPLGDASAR
mgnify:CR=1 FL=1